MITVLIVLAVLFVAYGNGANDNFKGVATLFGSGTTDYKKALAWATVTTLAGSLLALVLAHGLIDTFKGKGLVPDAVIAQPQFLLAVSLGAAATVYVATLLGLPVSTTHALTGGLVGAGLLAAAGDVRLDALGYSFVLPLLCAPLVSLLLTVVIYPALHWGRSTLGITSTTCVCVGATPREATVLPDGTAALVRPGVAVQVGQAEECFERYEGHLAGLEAGPILDGLHYLSAGAVGFARGLNDTPKIVALVLAGQALSPNMGLILVTVVMAVGGVLNARRVAETMSRKITRMNAGQGLTANLITAILVTTASRFGLPVSTTHISCGAIFGIGVVRGSARWNTILSILLAWVTTLPLAALLAATVYVVATVLNG